MNIVLTGMRGSGKSYYGRALARLLSWKYIDTDELIEKKENLSITEIVQKHGWPYFRKLEKELCKKLAGTGIDNLAGTDETVISTGGGMIIDRENEAFLRQNGKIVFLYRTPEKCAEFILKGHKKDQRPSLANENGNSDISTHESLLKELNEIWNDREKRYRQSADLIVDANKEKTTPEQILDKLETLY